MKNLITLGILAAGFAAGALIMTIEPKMAADTHDDGAAEEFERGPHRGRLLSDGALALEVTIFEDGVPPEYRVYAYRDDKPIAPTEVDMTIELGRLGGVVDRFTFAAEGDYLRGSGVVVEPHSFDVKVAATIGGRSMSWAYESYEGRTTIPAAVAEASGLRTEVAGPAAIRDVVPLTGRIVTDPARTARVGARFPGMIREMRATLGATVKQGDTIAVVESNDSLQPYTVRAPIGGTVTAQHANVGETVDSGPIVEIADLSRLVAELYAFPRDVAKIAVGQATRVKAADGEAAGDGAVAAVMPAADAASQAVAVRVPLANDALAWRIGMAVTGSVTVGEREVPLAVRMSGLQAFRDFTVVFARVDDTYEVRMLELGADDGTFIEVLGGLDPGTAYVTENSFLIKADVEKSGASHDH
jgi:cobalt-zinc-cadmium efflux system membrane fusion protein